MKKFLFVPALAAVLAIPAFAEPVTKTVTIDRPNYDGTRTIVRDKDAGTLSRDTQVTRASDGATATREYDRTRTADGFTASGSSTNFKGETRSFERTHTRTRLQQRATPYGSRAMHMAGAPLKKAGTARWPAFVL